MKLTATSTMRPGVTVNISALCSLPSLSFKLYPRLACNNVNYGHFNNSDSSFVCIQKFKRFECP